MPPLAQAHTALVARTTKIFRIPQCATAAKAAPDMSDSGEPTGFKQLE
jgi:hypothetical protein